MIQLSDEMLELFKKFERPSWEHVQFDWNIMRAEAGLIRSYVETVASAFEREFDAFDAKLAEEVAKLPDEMRADRVEDETPRAFDLAEHFPAFSWRTTFVAIYTFLEDTMLSIAKSVGHHLKLKLVPDDLKDTGIFAAKSYLEMLCDIEFPERKHHWQEVHRYRPIRNALVHSGGRITKDRKAIRKFAEGKKSIKLENDRIFLSKEFCQEVLDNVEGLLNDLFELAKERVTRGTN